MYLFHHSEHYQYLHDCTYIIDNKILGQLTIQYSHYLQCGTYTLPKMQYKYIQYYTEQYTYLTFKRLYLLATAPHLRSVTWCNLIVSALSLRNRRFCGVFSTPNFGCAGTDWVYPRFGNLQPHGNVCYAGWNTLSLISSCVLICWSIFSLVSQHVATMLKSKVYFSDKWKIKDKSIQE